MDIEDSSVPYRAFLRSGSYPAITERFVRSGGVLVRAAGWAALVVVAASAGYNTTQRFVTPSAADTSEPTRLVTAHAALPVEAPVAQLAQPVHVTEPVHELAEHDTSTQSPHNLQRSNALAQATTRAAVVPPIGARKRTGAVVQHEAQPTLASNPDVQLEASLTEASRTEQIAERVRALDSAPEIAPAQEPATPSAVTAVVEAVLREDTESATKSLEPAPLRAVEMYAKAAPPTARAPKVVRAAPQTNGPSLPLSAAARIDGLVVRGPLSAAHVRRSVERVRPTLSHCYNEAARQAGHNRFAPVRVQVTIDEAGRVKSLPKVEGAQLPGFGECLSTAMSKLVCQTPDTGTAWASITLGFVPERR